MSPIASRPGSFSFIISNSHTRQAASRSINLYLLKSTVHKANIMTIQRFILTVLASAAILSCHAIPAMKITTTVTQPDGTSLDITLAGDERLHYHVTSDGIPVGRHDSGSWNYLKADGDRLTVTETAAHSPELRTAAESEFISTLARPSELRKKIAPRKLPARKVTMEGKKRGLIVLVDFKDEKFTMSRLKMDSIANHPGYDYDYFNGSVRDYFLEQSNGKLDITFDVVGPYCVSNEMAYYGTNGMFGDVRPGQMVAEALLLADKDVDFKNYDWSGNGEVDQVVIIYAGYGEAMGASPVTIWPHENRLILSDYGAPMTLDGVKIDTYAAVNELYANPEVLGDLKKPCGTGPICHEFAHCMGIPDFYDVDDPLDYTTGTWDLMDQGCYNYGTDSPAGFTAYEKWISGWQEPIVLDTPVKVENVKSLTEGGDFFVIYNDQFAGSRNEFYLLENRQKKGFDFGLNGEGLLISHVIYHEGDWNTNMVNYKHKKGYRMVAANNQLTYNVDDEAGHPFPYRDNDAFTDNTSPAAEVENVTEKFTYTLGKPVENIVKNPDGTISFTFMGGTSGIEESVSTTEQGETCWDLQGRRSDGSAPGITIVKRGDNILKLLKR